ncbi:hypothetical protein QEP67_21420 [Bacillus cereus group sp. MS39]|uniref:Uncharacterized protein n=1 Tax=Bacillus cereus group sp. MS39 TaxID=3041344 RepID=A0AAU8F325_9BACI
MIDMMYISYKLTKPEYNNLFRQLQTYLKEYRTSQQLRKDSSDKGAYISNALSKFGFQEIRLRSNKWGYRSIEIRLRPQLLIDPNGYYRLTKLSEFKMVQTNFNYVLRDILSLNVPDFFEWKAKRIEPAIDLNVDEVLISKYLFLFKKGSIPDYFLDNKQTQKHWNSNTNVYLMSKHKAVNWYNRYETLLLKEQKANKNFLDFSETRGILRFETQARNSDEFVIDVLNQQRCKKEIMKFYKQIVGKGDYYKLENAIELVNQKVDTGHMQMSLKMILRLIDKCGSIVMAKNSYIQGKDIHKAADAFSKRINLLRNLGINPVTLPSDWEISYLENLHDKIEERLDEEETSCISL